MQHRIRHELPNVQSNTTKTRMEAAKLQRYVADLGNSVKGALAGKVLLKYGAQQVVLASAGRLLRESV